jgi:hypothetical protein
MELTFYGTACVPGVLKIAEVIQKLKHMHTLMHMHTMHMHAHTHTHTHHMLPENLQHF